MSRIYFIFIFKNKTKYDFFIFFKCTDPLNIDLTIWHLNDKVSRGSRIPEFFPNTIFNSFFKQRLAVY